jgi:hypothetical protein
MAKSNTELQSEIHSFGETIISILDRRYQETVRRDKHSLSYDKW